MKSIRTLLVPAGLIAALALPSASFAQVNAQQAPAGQHQPGAHHNGFMRAIQGLNLSADQQSRLKALMEQYHQAHPKGSAPDPQARKTLHEQMMAILTPAQQTQFKANMQAMRGNEAGERPGADANGAPGSDAPRGSRMMQRFAALNLSDQQKSQIQALIGSYQQSHPQGSPRDPQAMQALRNQINAILTPAQQQQLQQMRQNGDGGGR